MDGKGILLPVLVFVVKGTRCRVNAAEAEEAVAAANAAIVIADGVERERGPTGMPLLLLLLFLSLAKNVVAQQVAGGPVL